MTDPKHNRTALSDPSLTAPWLAQCVDAVWEMDRHGVITRMEGELEAITGYPPAAYIGRHYQEIPGLSPRVAGAMRQIDAAFERREPFYNLTFELHHPAGRLLFLMINGAPFTDEQGEYVGYRGISLEVTQEFITTGVLERIKGAVRGTRGESYFRVLVQALGQTLRTDLALVGRLDSVDGAPVLTAEAVYSEGDWSQNLTLPLADTPLMNLYDQDSLVVVEALKTQLPGGHVLIKLGVESVAATGLWGNQGQLIGILAVFRQQRLEQPAVLQNVLEVFADRAALELDRQLAAVELQAKDSMLSQAYLADNIGAWVYNIQDNTALWSQEANRVVGIEHENAVGPDVLMNITHPGDFERVGEAMRASLERGQPMDVRWRRLYEDGEIAWMHSKAQVVMDEHGKPFSLVGVVKDITAEKASEERLSMLSEAVLQSSNAVAITNLNAQILYINPAFEQMTGWTDREAIGQKTHILKSGYTPHSVYEALWQTIATGKPWTGELHNKRKDGTLYWAYTVISPIKSDDGEISHFVSVQDDITLRKEQEQKLIHQAYYDSLTNLPNRLLAVDRLAQSIKVARRSGRTVAVLFVDLDGFKHINDTLGHDVGDRLLVKASRRLCRAVRDSDTVARLGGDEFLLILEEDTANAAEITAQRVLNSLSVPINLEGRLLTVTASIGVSRCPSDGDTPELLMRNADAAMYRAKDAGRNNYHFFTPEMNMRMQQRLEMESYLRHALSKDEFRLHYQPVVEITTGRLMAVEALLRWEHPLLGTVPPDDFIPLAEEIGLIIDIGEWIIDTACRDCRYWRDNGYPDMRVGVNVSPRQFRGTRILYVIGEALERHQLPADCMAIEVTEGLLVDNFADAYTLLRKLSELGLQIAIDDFGTGYSSLSYLKHFPFSTLKVDRNFINDMQERADDATLVSTIVTMAHNLGLGVIGEGVENSLQLRMLRSYGCDMAQGYHFCRPLPFAKFNEYLATLNNQSVYANGQP